MGNESELKQAVDEIAAMSGIEVESVAGHGDFSGLPAQIELDENGRSARLLRAITYRTQAAVDWPVPESAWLDGASIPQAFWSIIGGPFEGKYREPSIVHDHYCITHTRAWRDTHRMFYEAMLCRGVPGFKARIMFYAVYRFGPRWEVAGSVIEAASPGPLDTPSDASVPTLLQDAQLLRTTPLSIDQIEALAEESARHGCTTPSHVF